MLWLRWIGWKTVFQRVAPPFSRKFTAKLAAFLKKFTASVFVQINVQMGWMRWKNKSQHFLQQFNAKFIAFPTIKSPRNSPHFLQKNSPHLLSNVCWIWFKFSTNIVEVRDSWHSAKEVERMQDVRVSNPCKEVSFLFEYWERSENLKKFSAIHRTHRKKDVRKTRGKLFFLNAFHTIFPRQTSTRVSIHVALQILNS